MLSQHYPRTEAQAYVKEKLTAAVTLIGLQARNADRSLPRRHLRRIASTCSWISAAASSTFCDVAGPGATTRSRV